MSIRFSRHIRWWSPAKEVEDWLAELESMKSGPEVTADEIEDIDMEIRRVRTEQEYARQIQPNEDGRLMFTGDS